MLRHKLSALITRSIFVALVAMMFSSCTEESLSPISITQPDKNLSIADFPAEITLNNWEVFVSAPASVIDFHQKQELLLQSPAPQGMSTTGTKPGNEKNRGIFFFKGFVKAFSNVWQDVPNVVISVGDQRVLSFQNNTPRGYNYFFGLETDGPMCMEFDTEASNGMTPLDMVLIKKHMTGQTPLENVWQMLAADVNNDGDINDVDLHNIQQVLLERERELPDTDNVVFIGEDELNKAQVLLETGNLDGDFLAQLGRTPACAEGTPNRYAIKVGDVNGSATFR